jgi:shikimate kinase
MTRIVTLTGYRGSGKSTVAPILADQLACDWIDADIEIERRSKRTIQEIFETSGENEFRELERALMRELLSGPSIVIAAGGGAVLNQQTRREMRDAGPVVWLKASAAELARRITTDPTTGQRRPSLTGQGVEQEIAMVLANRQSIYSAVASVEINTEGLSSKQIVNRILEQLPDVNSTSTDRDDGTISASGDRPC